MYKVLRKLFASFSLKNKKFNFSVRSRLLLGFVVIIALLLLLAAIALLSLSSYKKGVEAARTTDTTARQAQDLRTLLSTEALDFSTLLIRQEANLATPFETRNRMIDQVALPILQKAQLEAGERTNLDRILSQREKLNFFYKQALTQIKDNDYVAANILWVSQIQPIMEDANKRAASLDEQLIKRADQGVQYSNEQATNQQNWFLMALTIALILSMWVARTTTKAIVVQNFQLKNTLHDLLTAHKQIETKRKSGEVVSQEVLELAAELKNTASEQAAGSNGQVQVVIEVSHAMEELSHAAENIAEMSNRVNAAVSRVAISSQHIQETTTRSVQQSQQGRASVDHTIAISQEVASLYQTLVNLIKDLDTRHNNMRRILDLLNSISAETHLLSLNASIEAAATGEHGERFGVVAQEVKNLATRSKAASREVLGIINEIEDVTTNVLKAAESGYAKAFEMADASEQSGTVIEGMRQVSEESQQQAITINSFAQEVKGLTEIIRAATNEQHAASEKVLDALTGLTVVANQNVSSSNLVSSTANTLEEVSRKLKVTLVAT